MKRNSSAAGFTLIEILVVVLIGSIVMVVLISVLGSSFEILRTGETRAQLNSNARIALEYICDDIVSASGIPLSFDRDRLVPRILVFLRSLERPDPYFPHQYGDCQWPERAEPQLHHPQSTAILHRRQRSGLLQPDPAGDSGR
jgi:prepilin-type N-terminal cleavage/methylation domain-containing protein